jgi:hypothetical protein
LRIISEIFSSWARAASKASSGVAIFRDGISMSVRSTRASVEEVVGELLGVGALLVGLGAEPVPHAEEGQVAESFGGVGIRVERDADVPAAVERALETVQQGDTFALIHLIVEQRQKAF